jgi:hypothetical protein
VVGTGPRREQGVLGFPKKPVKEINVAMAGVAAMPKTIPGTVSAVTASLSGAPSLRSARRNARKHDHRTSSVTGPLHVAQGPTATPVTEEVTRMSCQLAAELRGETTTHHASQPQ